MEITTRKPSVVSDMLWILDIFDLFYLLANCSIILSNYYAAPATGCSGTPTSSYLYSLAVKIKKMKNNK
jgi:hypothetical protein